MASPDDKIATKADSCPDESQPQRGLILPWKPQPATNPAGMAAARGDAQIGKPAWAAVTRIDETRSENSGFILLSIDKIKRMIESSQPVREARPKWLSPAELHHLYAGTLVPAHRYFTPLLSAAANSPSIAMDPEKWLAGIPEVNISKVVDAWLNTNKNTEYEQLSSIGLDSHTSCLTAALTIKKGRGYSGGPATAGSREFVAFWVDWGAGMQYEGTTAVVVHDFSSLPPGGLEYGVLLPVDLLSRAKTFGGDARKIKVLAVLSWNIPPSTTDPNSPVVWGNRIESMVQIPAAGQLHAVSRVSADVAPDPTEIDLDSSSGRIIAAAIRSLTELTFGPDAGLTVLPDSALTGPGTARESLTMNIASRQDSACPFTLYAWDRTKVNRGAVSNLKFAPAGSSRPVNSEHD